MFLSIVCVFFDYAFQICVETFGDFHPFGMGKKFFRGRGVFRAG